MENSSYKTWKIGSKLKRLVGPCMLSYRLLVYMDIDFHLSDVLFLAPDLVVKLTTMNFDIFSHR